MADWAELPQDLLALIAKRIDLLEDFSSFGRVCRLWRSVVVKQNFKGSQQIPWLMLAEEEEEEDNKANERRFVSATTGDVIGKMVLPEIRGKRCFESLGWLITVAQDGDMSLFHPSSRAQISLPHMNTLEYYEEGSMINNFVYIQKAVLSSSPSSPSNNKYAVMVIYEGRCWMAFWRCGDMAWTTIETHRGAFWDITYYKGQYYGVNTRGDIYECDIGGLNPTVARLIRGIPEDLLWSNRSYIVELAGELLLVVRDGCEPRFWTTTTLILII